MWDMLDSVFSAIGRGGKVIDTEAEKWEVQSRTELQALKYIVTKPEVLEKIAKKVEKDLLKGTDVEDETHNPFAALRTEKEGQ